MNKLIVVLLLVSFSAHSMRCNNQLIMEDDSVSRVLSLCGDPTEQNYSYLVYENKDGDGMDYRLHIGPNGRIDAIESRRGLL